MPPVAALTPLGSQPAVLGRGPSGPSKAALVEVTGDLYSEALSPSSRALRTNGPRLAHSSCRTVLPPDLSVPRPFGELLLGLLAGSSLALPPRFPRCPSPELRARPSSPVVLCPHLDIPQTPQTRWTRSGGMAVDSDISNSACLKSESITVLSWRVRFQSLGGLNQKPLSSFRSFFLPYNRRQSATSHVRSPSQFLKYVSSFSVLLSERFASSSPVCFAVSCPSHPSPPPHSVLRPVAGQGCLTADLVGPP